MAETQIEWTDATWNPVAGCTIVSAGCTNCYAMEMAKRLQRMMDVAKYQGILVASVEAHHLERGPVVREDKVRWKSRCDGKGQEDFCNSMSDLFHESVSDCLHLENMEG